MLFVGLYLITFPDMFFDLVSITFFSCVFFPAPGVDEFVEGRVLSPHPQ